MHSFSKTNGKTDCLKPIDGILVIDKPDGWTSHDVVARVRRILKTRRAGHTGTLDPFATGVLVVCLNQATRLVQFLTGDEKEYLAVMRLGYRTDTGDLTGKPLEPATDVSAINESDVREALKHFSGKLLQIPPMYSAKKVGGVKLYEMARRGEEIERQPIEVEIREIELISGPLQLPGQPSTKTVTFRVLCSSGTYVRTLAEDIGKRMGVGAHLIELRRTRAGSCSLNQAVTLEDLARLAEEDRLDEVIIGMSEALQMQQFQLANDEITEISHGRPISRQGFWEDETPARLCDAEGRLLAIAKFDANRQLWRPRLVFARD